MIRNTVYATFSDPKMAERAGGALLDHGVKAEDLSIIQSHEWRDPTAEEVSPAVVPTTMYIVPNSSGLSTGLSPFVMEPVIESNEEIHKELVEVDPQPNLEEMAKHGMSMTTPEDAAAGALKGTAWGAGLGAAAALASLFIPGVGLVLGGGALATAMAGFAASAGAGAGAGAITGLLKDQGIESHVAGEYDQAIRSGGAVLGLTLPSGNVDEAKAWEILTKYAGNHVTSYVDRAYVG